MNSEGRDSSAATPTGSWFDALGSVPGSDSVLCCIEPNPILRITQLILLCVPTALLSGVKLPERESNDTLM
jgi:hypothetical protein